MKVLMFILGVFLIPSIAVAGISTAPARELWSLATDDVVKVNLLTKTANASVYLNSVEGTVYRATATTTSARLLTVTEGAISGGRLNPYLTGALFAAGLSYEAYQWYKSTDGTSLVPVGTCDSRSSWGEMTPSACVERLQKYYDTEFFAPYPYHVTTLTNTYELNSGKKYQFAFHHEYRNTAGGSLWTQNQNNYWHYTRDIEMSSSNKQKVDSSVAEIALLNALSSAPSSRAGFGENNQPYPLDGLFTNEDLSVDPTFSPSADLNIDTLPDYIKKYNNGLLQTTDPSQPNYVTPAQLAYIKSQAEAAAAIAAGGTPENTNPLADMKQPITQAQYDDSNLKTATAEKAAINAVVKPELSGLLKPLDDYKTDIESTNSNTVSTINKPSSLGYGSSTCWRPTLKSFNGTTVSPGDAYCSDYDSFSNPLAVWALWIGTALYLWHFGREQLTERV